jgi:chromosome partitioning protein
VRAVKIVTVVNYKGGVGKTTLTANVGAEIARQGKRVLLIDLDPQASLTLSLYRPEEWRARFAPGKTIKHWFEGARSREVRPGLSSFVTSPPRVNFYIPPHGGRLDLVASDLTLGDLEEDLAIEVGGARVLRSRDHYLDVFGRITAALNTIAPEAYDLVLIDCPPNFGIITRSAVAASDCLLVPARPDELSTLALDHLAVRLNSFRNQYNAVAASRAGERAMAKQIAPRILGIIFTMVKFREGRQPIRTSQYFIDQTRERLPTFDAMVRESHLQYSDAAATGIPVVLSNRVSLKIVLEMRELVGEFIRRMGVFSHGGQSDHAHRIVAPATVGIGPGFKQPAGSGSRRRTVQAGGRS